MLWLGRFNRWGPGYWHRLAWGEFKAYLIEARQRVLAQQKAERKTPTPEDGFDDPNEDDLRKAPWAGEGPDPLEEIWEQS